MKHAKNGGYFDALGNYYDVSGLSSESKKRIQELTRPSSAANGEKPKDFENQHTDRGSHDQRQLAGKILERAQRALAVRVNPSKAIWHARAAMAYAALEDLNGAQREANEAILADPTSPSIYNIAASVAELRGETKEQVKLFRHSLSLDPANPYTHYKLAAEHSFQGISPSLHREEVLPMCSVRCVTYVPDRASMT